MNKKNLFMGMAAMALLCACSNSEDSEALDNALAPQLSVFGTIDNGNGTRVDAKGTGEAWEANDLIGISTSGNTTESTNIKFTTSDTSGSFTSDTKVYITGSSVTVNAYYPYSSKVSNGSLDFNIAGGTDNAYTPWDLMYAQATELSKTSATATLSFAHKMNRLCLKLSSSDITINDDTEVTATFEGLITSGTFDTTTGAITPGSKTGKVVVSGGSEIYMIYPPQDNTASMTIQIGDKYYVAEVPLKASSAGTNLNYNVTINNSKVTLTLTSVTINGWGTDSETTSDISTTEQKASTSGEASNETTWGEGGSINVTKQAN